MVTVLIICFNNLKLYILPTECICEFRVILRVNSDYFPQNY
jgi:hypothetical protein